MLQRNPPVFRAFSRTPANPPNVESGLVAIGRLWAKTLSKWGAFRTNRASAKSVLCRSKINLLLRQREVALSLPPGTYSAPGEAREVFPQGTVLPLSLSHVIAHPLEVQPDICESDRITGKIVQ